MATALSERPFHQQSRSAERRVFELCCKVVDSHGQRPRLQYASDVSAGGMWLRTLLPLSLGEQVVVSLPGDDNEVSLFGEVVRVVQMRDRDARNKPGMAVRFLGMSPSERDRLHSYLATLPPKTNAVKDVLAWHLRQAN